MGFLINPYLVQPSGPSYDSDAQAFFTAAGITDTTQKSAVNQLVLDLKSYSIWTKMTALYPFVGGTSTTHSYNLKNTATFQLTFNGGGTHASTGWTPNGSNGYANTGLTPSTSLTQNNSHISLYNRTNNDGLVVDMGTRDASYESIMLTRWSNSTLLNHNTQYGSRMSPSNSDSRGHYIISRRGATDMEAYKNGSSIATSTATSGLTTNSIYLSAWNDSGTPSYYANREIAFASIGDGLTDTEAANFYTAVQAFQTTLSRQVGVPIVSDSDAQAFLNAAVITDVTQANAVNQLVTDLKGYSIWTKMKALYPFVGGTASTHKWNLKNPVDSDAAFRLVFNGGVSHTSSGVAGNGTNAYYDTKFNPSVQLTSSTGGSAFIYVFNDILDAGVDLAGYQTGVNTRFQVMSRYAGSFYASMLATNLYSASNSNAIGFYGGTRPAGNTTTFYAVKDANSYSYSDSYANPNCIVMGLAAGVDTTSVSFYTNRGQSFSCMGEGLSTTEAQNLRTAVLAFNTTLGR